ncbi:antitoxin [Halochromatium roseum]|uniref:antitoxin n=1 Tax=Halochromatium roseum TaxID=391920 RepID=UPI001911623C|nr:antitoxin [Halochromatium roseum]MBK5937723.1 antitoxin [Halochromatium roseum]
MSRLTIDITEQQHQALKAMAALEGKSIKQFTLERLFIAQTGDEDGTQALKALLAERVAEARRGGVVEESISKIAEDTVRSIARS